MTSDQAEKLFHECQPALIARVEEAYWKAYGDAMREHTNRNTPVIQRAVRTAAWQAVVDAVNAETSLRRATLEAFLNGENPDMTPLLEGQGSGNSVGAHGKVTQGRPVG